MTETKNLKSADAAQLIDPLLNVSVKLDTHECPSAIRALRDAYLDVESEVVKLLKTKNHLGVSEASVKLERQGPGLDTGALDTDGPRIHPKQSDAKDAPPKQDENKNHAGIQPTDNLVKMEQLKIERLRAETAKNKSEIEKKRCEIESNKARMEYEMAKMEYERAEMDKITAQLWEKYPGCAIIMVIMVAAAALLMGMMVLAALSTLLSYNT